MSNSATQPALRPDYSPAQLTDWLARHERNAATARTGRHDVIFFGDSLTEHWRTRGLALWERWLAPLLCANFGMSGDRTQQVLWRMQHGELEGHAPKVLVLLIGTNNLDCGLGENSITPRNTPAQIVEGIAAIVQLAQRNFPSAWVLLHALFPRGAVGAPVRGEIAEINASLQALAQNQPRVRYLDLGPKLTATEGTRAPALMPDLLHLSEAGYEIWAHALRETLAELLRP